MRYSSDPLTKRNHFGHVGGVDPNFLFSLRKTISAFIGTNEERQACLTKGTASTLWDVISDRRFESTDCRLLRKPVFLFGDSIEENEEVLFDGNYKWLHQIGGIVLSSLTWNKCFHYHICSLCLFPSTWTEIWSGRSQASQSGGSLIVLLFSLVTVEKFLYYSQV